MFYKSFMFVITYGDVSHFHPSLIFAAKARSLLFLWNPGRGSTRVGSGLAQTYFFASVNSFIVQAQGNLFCLAY
jgi:hypothetical protein